MHAPHVVIRVNRYGMGTVTVDGVSVESLIVGIELRCRAGELTKVCLDICPEMVEFHGPALLQHVRPEEAV